jgi:hypothetical protein
MSGRGLPAHQVDHVAEQAADRRTKDVEDREGACASRRHDSTGSSAFADDDD